MKKCRRCLNSPNVSEAEIEKAVERLKAMKGIRLADSDTVSRRLTACSECDRFEYGSTCMLCGCLVRVRALMADGKCPYPKNNKWV